MTERRLLAAQILALIEAIEANAPVQIQDFTQRLNETISISLSNDSAARADHKAPVADSPDRASISEASRNYSDFKWYWGANQRKEALTLLWKAHQALRPTS